MWVRGQAIWLVILCAIQSIRGTELVATFEHGIASGDPLPNSIIIWTRVTPWVEINQTIDVHWGVYEDEALEKLVSSGVVVTSADQDWTVKEDVKNLTSQVPYFFRFTSHAAVSQTGTFKLPPSAGLPLEDLRFGVFSCANWPLGHYHAYKHAATQNFDFWLHLGDWIYEYGPPSPNIAVRHNLSPPHEAVTLDDYRKRHAMTRTDSSVQHLSRVSPLIAVWDDHEFANDAWTGGAHAHDPQTEGSWEVRKQAAIRAYHEWMPTRLEGKKIFRGFEFGNLATVAMLETRVWNRTAPSELPRAMNVVLDTIGDKSIDDPDVMTALDDIARSYEQSRNREDRELLGKEQLAWLETTLRKSVEARTRWQLIGQQTMVQDSFFPDLEASVQAKSDKPDWENVLHNLTTANGEFTFYDPRPYRRELLGTSASVNSDWWVGATPHNITLATLAMARHRISPMTDPWMGSVFERQKFLDVLKQASSPIIYAGDSHNAWAGTHKNEKGKIFAAEFDTTSISSYGWESVWGFLPLDFVSDGFVRANRDMIHSRVGHRGYLHVKLNHTSHVARFVHVRADTPEGTDYGGTCDAAFVVSPLRQGVKVREIDCSPSDPTLNELTTSLALLFSCTMVLLLALGVWRYEKRVQNQSSRSRVSGPAERGVVGSVKNSFSKLSHLLTGKTIGRTESQDETPPPPPDQQSDDTDTSAP